VSLHSASSTATCYCNSYYCQAAQSSAEARQQLYTSLVEAAYERGGALSVARTLETDDVIDPAESRAWIQTALEASPPPPRDGRAHRGKRRPCVSPW
jgi:acetyl-CoA carboxylase carboxyltransferase component